MRLALSAGLAKRSQSAKDRFGYVADLGDILTPPRTWDEIASLITPGLDLSHQIRQHMVTVVVITYRRGANSGAIALEVWPTRGGDIAVRRLQSAADTEQARSVRSGMHARELRDARVAVVGVGALGSFVADMLVRSGIRRLELMDDEIVIPGNVVRHLVGPDAVGLSKVVAVKRCIDGRYKLSNDNVIATEEMLTSGPDAAKLLRGNDLVVNATADFATTALLHLTAQSVGAHVLSAALQNDGSTYRIDVLPPLSEAEALPPSPQFSDSTTSLVFENGCGSPVSPTPPHAVVEAAAATVRHAIGLLTSRPLHPAGEVRTLQEPPEQVPHG